MGEDWQGMLRRLPSDWQEQAIQLKAWQRMRKLACVSDLLRALLVYAACGYSFRQLGLWATLMGLGSLSERAWRKRVERAQEWISWLLGALIGSQQSPGWLPKTAGRVWLIDASRLKTPAGSGEEVKLHSAYNLCIGRARVRRGQRPSQWGGAASFCLAQRGCGRDRRGLSTGSQYPTRTGTRSVRGPSGEQPSGAPGARRRPQDRSARD